MQQHFQLMRKNFHWLNDKRFQLINDLIQPFKAMPTPQRVCLNRVGLELAANIKKKAVVHRGMLLATHPSPCKGDLLASIHGVVTEVNERFLMIEGNNTQEDNAVTEGFDLLGSRLTGEVLCEAAKKLGITTEFLAQDCKTLIINGLNPDPGVTWAESMLVTHVETFQTALELLRRMSPAETIILAAPEGLDIPYKDLQVSRIEPRYPNSLDSLVIKAVTGEEAPEGVGVVSLHDLWSLGHVGQTKQPLTETLLTLGSRKHSASYVVSEGCPVGELLHFAHIPLADGDTVVCGGPLRGESVDDLNRGVAKTTYGIFVVEAGTVPPRKGDSPCISCGACIAVCPARLAPGTISSCAEFGAYERCREEYVDHCFDCGLCSYICSARRPVLQYIRMAKHKLAESKTLQAL